MNKSCLENLFLRLEFLQWSAFFYLRLWHFLRKNAESKMQNIWLKGKDEKDERKLAALVSRFEASENIVRVRLIENPNLF